MLRKKTENSLKHEHTGLWAWKHTHQADGSVDYKNSRAMWYLTMWISDMCEKIVLHDVDLFATPGQKIAFVGTTELERLPSLTLSTASTI